MAYSESVTNGERKKARSPHQPTGQWISTKKRLAIYLRDGFTCQYCGTDLRDAKPTEIHLDHLVTKSSGGTNREDNLITACRACNCSRQDRIWTEYATGGAVARILVKIHQPLNIKLAEAIIEGRQDRAVADIEG